MIISNKAVAVVLTAVLASAFGLALQPLDASAQAQGSSYTFSSGLDALGQSSSQCADLGGSWSNSTATCTVSGKGSIGPEGTLVIDPGAALTISKGATFAIAGTIQNNGTVTNAGTIQNNGTLANSGTFTSYGSVVNVGTISNSPSGIIINSGAFNNEPNGSVTNARDFYNSGTIDSSGSFTNSCSGELFESGTFTGSPVLSCGTTSTFSQSTLTAAPAKSSSPVVLGAIVVLAIAVAVAFLLWRGGIIKTSNVNSKK